MPEGAEESEGDEDVDDDDAKKLNIDLTDVWSTPNRKNSVEGSKKIRKKKKTKKAPEPNNSRLSSDEETISQPITKKEIVSIIIFTVSLLHF